MVCFASYWQDCILFDATDATVVVLNRFLTYSKQFSGYKIHCSGPTGKCQAFVACNMVNTSRLQTCKRSRCVPQNMIHREDMISHDQIAMYGYHILLGEPQGPRRHHRSSHVTTTIAMCLVLHGRRFVSVIIN